MIVPNEKRIIVKQLKKEENYSGLVVEGGALMDHSLSYGKFTHRQVRNFPKALKSITRNIPPLGLPLVNKIIKLFQK